MLTRWSDAGPGWEALLGLGDRLLWVGERMRVLVTGARRRARPADGR